MIRRLKESLLALLPLLIGLLWTIALMHLSGLKFNLANVWGLPADHRHRLGVRSERGPELHGRASARRARWWREAP